MAKFTLIRQVTVTRLCHSLAGMPAIEYVCSEIPAATNQGCTRTVELLRFARRREILARASAGTGGSPAIRLFTLFTRVQGTRQ